MKRDNFLSDVMKCNCGVANFDISNELVGINNFKFAYAKTKISTSKSLIAKKHNFYLANITVKFRQELVNSSMKLTEQDKVVVADETVRDSVIKIANENFMYDRFHCDPNISSQIASEIKGKWVDNFFKGKRGDKCFVILTNKIEAKGFLLTIIRQNEVVIDLIAVDQRFQKEGVAGKLIKGMMSYYKQEYLIYSVGTQVSNIPSIKLYEKCGFSAVEYGLVWHYFNDK